MTTPSIADPATPNPVIIPNPFIVTGRPGASYEGRLDGSPEWHIIIRSPDDASLVAPLLARLGFILLKPDTMTKINVRWTNTEYHAQGRANPGIRNIMFGPAADASDIDPVKIYTATQALVLLAQAINAGVPDMVEPLRFDAGDGRVLTVEPDTAPNRRLVLSAYAHGEPIGARHLALSNATAFVEATKYLSSPGGGAAHFGILDLHISASAVKVGCQSFPVDFARRAIVTGLAQFYPPADEDKHPTSDGWALFDLDSTGIKEIQKDDEAGRFASDEDAVRYVVEQAIKGDAACIEAAAAHFTHAGAAAELRAAH